MFRQSLKKKQSLAEHSFTIFYLTFCEMKYSRYEYTQDADESKKLERRIQAFQSEYKDHESIRTVLVTTKGLTQGEHSDDFAKVLIDIDSQLPYQKAANCRIKNRPTVASDFC